MTLSEIAQEIGAQISPEIAALPVTITRGASLHDAQPGDIVFFENTYTWGLSHVGIYIGNNQFVHAENENTGVKVSDITSNYYSTRYYGARRLT